jgi:hypothetical protein
LRGLDAVKIFKHARFQNDEQCFVPNRQNYRMQLVTSFPVCDTSLVLPGVME